MIHDDVISYKNPKSIASESYRALRTNLQFSLSSDDQKVILVTSSHIGEGKSSVSSNLATVFAMQDKRTVLVDCDMRRGVQHKKFGLSNKNGLSNYLANMCVDKNLIQSCEIKNLYIITSGMVPPNPAELLAGNRMKELLINLKEYFDIIILDGAPVIPVTDSVILSSICDKVVLVTSSGDTRKDELRISKESIENAGATIAGVVFNKVDIKNKSYGKYGKGYYGSYYKYSSSED